MQLEFAQKAGEVVSHMRPEVKVDRPAPNAPGTINWNDYNFPPFLHLVHFSLSELQGPVKRFVLNAYLSFVIVVIVLCINRKTCVLLVVVSTIIQVIKFSPAINVFYSILSRRTVLTI